MENNHQKNSKWMGKALTILVILILLLILVPIAVFMGNSSDKPTEINGIIEYEELEN